MLCFNAPSALCCFIFCEMFLKSLFCCFSPKYIFSFLRGESLKSVLIPLTPPSMRSNPVAFCTLFFFSQCTSYKISGPLHQPPPAPPPLISTTPLPESWGNFSEAGRRRQRIAFLISCRPSHWKSIQVKVDVRRGSTQPLFWFCLMGSRWAPEGFDWSVGSAPIHIWAPAVNVMQALVKILLSEVNADSVN